MDKKTLRKHIIALRSEKTRDERIEAETIVFNLLKQFDLFFNAKNISSFVDFRDEISMTVINQAIIDAGKTLLLPYISPTTKEMQFYMVEDLSSLKRNSFGILEPDPEMHSLYDESRIDCVLTPGVAFDAKGYRLGYGGGFYDRFFSRIEKAIPKIGIAFDLQCVETIPVEYYDHPITHIITEKGIRTFN
jgi:5-formyltetrahydrofolate cyclo-ligase